MITTYDFSERTMGSLDLARGSSRQLLLEAIAELAARRAGPRDINALAIRLSTKFPQSGLTIDEICRRIGQALSGEGADEHFAR